jgi:hypothetical protein
MGSEASIRGRGATRRTARRGRHDRPSSASDWILLAALVALVAWTRDRRSRCTTPVVGALAAGAHASVGALLFIGALFIDPARYRQRR